MYDDKGAVSTADTGFRVSLAVPVIRSRPQLETIEQAWGRLGSDTSEPQPPLPLRPRLEDDPFADPVLELTALARAATDPVMKRRLERLRAVLAEEHLKLLEQRNRNARETLRFGGLLCLKLHDEGHNVAIKRARYAACVKANGKDYLRCVKLAGSLARDEKTLSVNMKFYADSVVRTAQNFPDDPGILKQELAALQHEIGERGYGAYSVYPDLFHQQVVSYAGSGRVRRETWYDRCVEMK